MADLNQYTVNIVNAEELYVQGKKIEAFDLGALTSLNATYGIGIRTDFPRLTLDVSGTDAMRIPMGTTAQQPSTTIFDATHPYTANTGRELDGCIRYNTEKTKFESWSSVDSSWVDLGGVSSNDRQEIITADSTNGIIFKTNNSNRMRIDNNGNIGIHTTPLQDCKLNVNGKLRCTTLNINGTNVTATAAEINYLDINNLGTSQVNKVVTADSQGNVGIGKSPESIYKLDVSGTVKATALMYGTTDVATELSSIQSDIDSKQDRITGAASNITAADLTASKALVSDNSGKVYVSTVTSDELGYLDGVTSSIQTQLGTKAPIANPTFTGTFRAGNGNTASGDYSVAMGIHNTASGNYSVAMGYYNEASGIDSVAMGTGNTASGGFSVALCASNTTSGVYCFAAGWSNTPKSSMSACMGRKNDILAEAYYAFAAGVCNKIALNASSGATYGCVALGNKAYVGEDIRFAIGISDTNPITTHATSASDSNNKFVIDKDGNVGIGTNSPGEKLEVNGTVKATNLKTQYFETHTNQLNTSSSNLYLQHNNNRDVIMCTGGGDVGIGNNSPAEKLHVSGNIKCSHILVNTVRDLVHLHCTGNLRVGGTYQSIGGSDGGGHLNYQIGYNQGYGGGTIGVCALKKNWTSKTRGSGYVGENNSNTWHVSIFSNGDMLCDGTYRSYSDERIKKNIVELDDYESLNLLRKIEVKKYNYIDTEKGLHDVYGFIAQQVDTTKKGIVTKGSSFIPNIMKYYTAEIDISNNEIIFTDLSGCTNISNSVGPSGEIIIRFEVKTQDKEEYNQLDLPLKKIVENKYYFPLPLPNNIESDIFVYGIYVHDFHTLDKQKLFALNFSATQEIDRIQQEEKTKLVVAETKLAAAEAEIAALKAKNETLESTLTNLLAELRANNVIS